MLAQGSQLLELIPQRPPMVMLSSLVSCNENITNTRLLLEADNIFLENGYFTEPGITENMAQSAAARTGWLAKKAAKDASFIAPVGVIGAIKNLQIFTFPTLGSLLETRIEVLFEFGEATIIKGTVNCAGKTVAECEMKIFLRND